MLPIAAVAAQRADDVDAAPVIDAQVLCRVHRVEIESVQPLHRPGFGRGIESLELILEFSLRQLLKDKGIRLAEALSAGRLGMD